jgi:hypothetical protein
MTCDLLRERERTRRRALWALASLHPGDSNASELLAILDDLDERGGCVQNFPSYGCSFIAVFPAWP